MLMNPAFKLLFENLSGVTLSSHALADSVFIEALQDAPCACELLGLLVLLGGVAMLEGGGVENTSKNSFLKVFIN